MEKLYTIKLTRNQIEELIHAVSTSYMDYDERMFYDPVLQEEYNKGVRAYNNTIDDIREILKESIKESQDGNI